MQERELSVYRVFTEVHLVKSGQPFTSKSWLNRVLIIEIVLRGSCRLTSLHPASRPRHFEGSNAEGYVL
jgi:hypothetical protein